jgi:site-specific DNA recombinase
MATAAIYARYSSAGQREESIEDQVRVCRAAIETAGDAVGHVYEDRATTGTTTDRRAGFMRMVADAQKGLFSAVYVYKLDRFARNRYDAAVYRRRLKQAGVRLVSATERTGDGPDGILLESMLEGLAEYYSANLSENVRRGLAGNAMKCRHNGIRVFGYDHGPDGRYVVNEGEAAAVRRVFAMYQQGEPFRAIIEALPAVRSKGGGPLTVQAVGKMLRNDKYCGVYRYGDTVVEGGMPAIIPRDEFDAVQRRLALRTRRRRSTVDYLLSGKLFDSEGHRYQSSSGHGKSGRKYTYYRCPATGHQVRRDALEAEVARMVADALAADDGAVEGIVADVMAEQEAALADDLAAVRAMEKRLQQNAREQSRMVDLAAKTGAVDAVAEKLNALADERAALEAEIADARAGMGALDAEQVEFWVRRVMGRSDPLEAVRLFVRRVVVDRAAGTLTAEFTFDKKEPPPDGPGRGSRKYLGAGTEGFEPPTAGTKNRSSTVELRPNVWCCPKATRLVYLICEGIANAIEQAYGECLRITCGEGSVVARHARELNADARGLLLRGDIGGADALCKVVTLGKGDRGARRSICGQLIACNLEHQIHVGRNLGIAKHHAAAVGRRRGDVPHARCNAACDGVLTDDGNLEALEHVGGAGKTDARLGLGNRGLALPHVMQAVDIGVGILERHAIGKQADIFLELLQSGLGVRAKIAVVLTAGKTQNVERALQGLNVGAMEIGHAQIERAVAQFIRGVYQGAPTGDIDGAASGKATVEPKGANSLLGGGAKALVGDLGVIDCIAELQKAGLDVLDGCSLHARCNRFHERTPFGVPFVLFERVSDRQRKGMHKHALNSVASCTQIRC